MKHVFLYAIGPVQDFIATARRSRDLWYGSWMLSELSKAAARKIDEQSRDSLIFPSPEDIKSLMPGSDLNSPNKIAALIDCDPETLANEVKAAVIFRLQDLSNDALGQVKGTINYQLAMKQIAELPEFYWASVPLESGDEYSIARDKAEALLAARKTTRNFEQATGEAIPKSSLDGARESVIPESEYPGNKISSTAKQQKIKNLFVRYQARQGERLSGVDLLKRLGNPDGAPKFQSTSDMAALPFFERIERESSPGKAGELLEKLQELIPDHNSFGAAEGLVFENRLLDDESTLEFSKKIENLLRNYSPEHSPMPYYAILAADGDNMGAVIDSQKTPDAHRKLSRALSLFAERATKIIREYKGCPIYTGGDDILSYLPMHTVLNCAKELEKEFRNTLVGFQGKVDNEPIFSTLSVGISVNHHIESLADALELAHNAEKKAKQVEGKNGLSIIVSKRSGADRAMFGSFETLYTRFNMLIALARKKEISTGTAYELNELHRILTDAIIPSDGITKEALRVIARKNEGSGSGGISEKTESDFKQWIEKEKIEVNDLATEMIIAKMFASYPEPKKEVK